MLYLIILNIFYMYRTVGVHFIQFLRYSCRWIGDYFRVGDLELVDLSRQYLPVSA